MAAKERVCFCCGKTYKYCPNCQGYDPEKTWMFIVHDEKCLDVYNTWQQYRGKQITKEDASRVLKAMDIQDILNSKSPVVPVIKEILDIKEEPKKVEPVEKEEIKTEVKRENQEKQQKHFERNFKK